MSRASRPSSPADGSDGEPSDREAIRAARRARKTAATNAQSQSTLPQPYRLRILALHGGMQCASTFASGQMKKVVKHFRDTADFVFIDAPFASRWPTETAVDERKRSWWRWNDRDAEDTRYAVNGHDQDAMVYHRLEDSLDVLWRAWLDHGGFDAIWGFSQGAVVASVFWDWALRRKAGELTPQKQDVVAVAAAVAVDHVAAASAPTDGPPLPILRQPRCFVFISAFMKPVPLNFPEYWLPSAAAGSAPATSGADEIAKCVDEANAASIRETLLLRRPLSELPLASLTAPNRTGVDGGAFVETRKHISDIPSLHIHGATDTIMPAARSLALAARYRDSVVLSHAGGHIVPNDPDMLDAMKRFVQSATRSSA